MAMPELQNFFGFPLRFGCFIIAALGLGIGGVLLTIIIMYAMVEKILASKKILFSTGEKKVILMTCGMSSILLLTANTILLLGVFTASSKKVGLAKWITFVFVSGTLGGMMYPSIGCFLDKDNCALMESVTVEGLLVIYTTMGLVAMIWLYFILTMHNYQDMLLYLLCFSLPTYISSIYIVTAYKTIYLTAFWTACLGFPIDEPIRVDLPVYHQPQDMPEVADSMPLAYDTAYARSIVPENHPGGDPVLEGNFISHKLQAASNFLDDTFESKAGFISGPFAYPVTKIESAVQETEGFGSKALSIKENIQNIVAGLFQPKPIVDTINEEEKYGNTGDKFYSAGQAVVGGASSVSNLVNTVLEVPGKIFSKITRAATEKLNNLGGKLIGL